MPIIELNNVNKGFGPASNRSEVLADINLSIEENEFVAIVGFSGSGKSTLVNLLTGLEIPDTGTVTFEEKPVTGPHSDRGIVFQNYSLLPWLTVTGNVELAVKQVFPQMSKKERRDHVARYIEMVNLTPASWKRPKELSGGMRQRVSVARTLAMQPKLLLLDEPLGALDALTRAQLQDEILNIWDQEKKTVVLITNDVDEAVLMADRIIPLTPGPQATLGKEFRVDLQRPRDRTTLNFNPEFKKIRNTVTQYLMELNDEAKRLAPVKDLPLPDIHPIQFVA
ncbi:MAG: ABC transporter ATP-binding protein [Phycisphaeraceae bacterium]|nr:ABC transporter ATP-binding protein [Phycisphaeraceae bacterium]